MDESDTIVAINTDPDARICDFSDYFVEGDLFEVLPRLTAAVESGETALEPGPSPTEVTSDGGSDGRLRTVRGRRGRLWARRGRGGRARLADHGIETLVLERDRTEAGSKNVSGGLLYAEDSAPTRSTTSSTASARKPPSGRSRTTTSTTWPETRSRRTIWPISTNTTPTGAMPCSVARWTPGSRSASTRRRARPAAAS